MAKKQLAVIGLAAYILTFGLSYLIFSQLGGLVGDRTSPVDESQEKGDRLTFEGDRTEVCPLNGAKYPKQQREWWEEHRPVGVIIENHVDSRPQSGLIHADIVYEVLVEGGITRFLAMYHCQDAGEIGPIRSARVYYLDFVSEYGEYPLFAHVGWANCNETTGSGCQNGARADARGQIRNMGWIGYNDLEQGGIPDLTYKRIEGKLTKPDGSLVATEHTVYSTTRGLWNFAEENRDIGYEDADGNAWDEDFKEYEFKDDPGRSNRGSVTSISYAFSQDSTMDVSWEYSAENNSYLRSIGGEAHTDLETGDRVEAKNVVVLFMAESPANDGYDLGTRLVYDTTGTGEALVYQDGREVEATWSKEDRQSRLILEDENGDEIEFTRGMIWFSVLDIGTTVSTD